MDKIRLVHLIPSFERAGAETIVSNISNFLPADEYEIHIVVLENSTAGFVRIDPSKNVHLHIANGFPFRVKNKVPWFNLKAFLSVRVILKSIDPQIIHSHLFESYMALNLCLVFLGRHYRFVHTAHTNTDHYKSKSLNSRLGLYTEIFSMRFVGARFVCVSKDMFNNMKNHFSASQLETVKNSVDTDYYSPGSVKPFELKKLNIPEGSFVLIHVGRFAEVKNHLLLFKAVEILKQRSKIITLLCLGSRGGLWNEYQVYIVEKKLNDSVIFVGEVDDPRPYILSSSLGLLPSFHEGLSLALLEMFSMGLPVLLSRIPSSEEVVNGVSSNLFIEVDDPSALADKIEDVIQNYNDYSETGRKMRDVVIESFSVIQLIRNYDKIYKRLLNRN